MSRTSSPINSQTVSLLDVPCTDAQVHSELDRPLVMVVDDEVVVAQTLSMILRHAGYGVVTAYNGEMALQLAATISPDLLLTDMRMPGMTGSELALAVCAILPKCKVMLLSGHATSEDLAPLSNAGVNVPLLIKPLPPLELLRQVARQVGDPLAALQAAKPMPAPASGELRFA